MWRYAVPAVLFLVLAAFFFRGLQLNPGQIESPLIGQCAPEFSLPNLEDPAANVGSADLEGRMALFNVWATWCAGCRQEHEFLLELASTGVPIYGLNWKDDRGAALDWLRTLGDPYVASAEDAIGDVAIDYGVYGAPETFLIAPDGEILHKHISPLTAQIWQSEFVPVIEAYDGEAQCEGS